MPEPGIKGIYVVTGGCNHVAVAKAAVAGGASVVQLRDDQLSDKKLLETAQAIRTATRNTSTLFIVNNRPDIALAGDADGVHIGQDDLPLYIVRRILGSSAIIGVSTGNVEEAIKAEAGGADYVAIGPIFPTMTKADAGSAVGLRAIAEIRQAVKIPVVAIGGISVENVASVAAAGADSAAVVSAVTGAVDMENAVRALIDGFVRGRKEGH